MQQVVGGASLQRRARGLRVRGAAAAVSGKPESAGDADIIAVIVTAAAI